MFWGLTSILLVQLVVSTVGWRLDESYENELASLSQGTWLQVDQYGGRSFRSCRRCSWDQYELSSCQKDRDTICAFCSFAQKSNPDWNKKCSWMSTPSTRNYEIDMYDWCPQGTWLQVNETGLYTCRSCKQCHWYPGQFELSPCRKDRDTICTACSYTQPNNSNWRQRCDSVTTTQSPYNSYDKRRDSWYDRNWATRGWYAYTRPPYNSDQGRRGWYDYTQPPYDRYGRRGWYDYTDPPSVYNCSRPFDDFELKELISCYFSTIVQWTFIVSLIIFSCLCLTAYKICTNCCRRPALQRQIEKVQLLSPAELDVLQQATKMIQEQKEKENHFDNPNFETV